MPDILDAVLPPRGDTVSMKTSNASVAATGVADPKAHAARDHSASAN